MVRIPRAMKTKGANHFCLWMVFCIFGFSLMAGCATAPKTLKPETTSQIKKLAIITALQHKELRVFDHTEVSKKTYGGFMFGAIGGALEGLAIGIETAVRIRSSLGGDPDILRKQLGQYPINDIFQENVTTKLSEKYQVVDANQFVNEVRVSKEGQELKIEDYMDVCRKCETDTMLKVDLLYGLAAYAREKSSAGIIANLAVYDIGTKTLLMKKDVVSDKYFKKSRVVHDFAANDSELYKKDIQESVNILSLIVARDFGLNVEMPQVKKVFAEFPDEISAIKMSCNKPYKMQDCSIWWGATRRIKIKDKKIRVAGSDDGKIVVVQDKTIANDESVFACFELVREVLLSKSIRILKVTKMMTLGEVKGCILELDGDGYSILKNYSAD